MCDDGKERSRIRWSDFSAASHGRLNVGFPGTPTRGRVVQALEFAFDGAILYHGICPARRTIVQRTAIPEVEYCPGDITRVTFVRGGIGWNFHQGPTLYRFPDGRLFMVWGVYDIQECSNDGATVFSVSSDNGETWADPCLWMKAPNAVVSHASLLQVRGTDTVIMPFAEGHFVGAEEDRRFERVTRWADYGATSRRIFVRTSVDGGVSWSEAREIPPKLVVGRDAPPFHGAPYQLMQLANGEILLTAAYLHPDHRNPQRFHAVVLRSVDGGRTWRKDFDFTVPEPRGAMEPWIAELDDGELYCVMRTKSGFLYQMRSFDYGRTWDGPDKSSIPSVESMPKMIRLQSGRLLLVWNNVSSSEQRPRYPLVAALSGDGGRSWDSPRVLADETGLNQLSNHDLIQLPDGRILSCVSHFRAQRPACSDLDMYVYDEAWLDRSGS